jgi:flagellar biosynthesis protein FlhG
LGVDAPEVTLSDYFSRRVEALSEVVSPTGITRVRLVSGALDGLTAANPKFAQKARLLNQLATLSADYILVDLSAGTSFNVLDFYLIADHRLLVVTPEPTCMENAYRFMKAAFYRHIKYLESHWSFKALLKQILEVSEQRDLQTPLDILQDVGNTHPEAALALKKELGSLSLDIVVNQVRTAQEARVGEVMATACVDYFGMLKPIWTTIPYDDAVWQSVRRRTPLTGFEQDGGAARGLRALVASLVVEEVALCP